MEYYIICRIDVEGQRANPSPSSVTWLEKLSYILQANSRCPWQNLNEEELMLQLQLYIQNNTL